MPVLSEWRGEVSGRVDPPTVLQLRLCAAPNNSWSASGSFEAVGVDGETYFVKPPGRSDLGKSLVTEFIVAEAGKMIGAPVCDPVLVGITAALLPFEYQPGYFLEEGVGFATRAIPPVVVEERPFLRHRARDDNARRHVGVFALYDWCWGSDEQWLHHVSDDWRLYSHDHGWYFPPAGPEWSVSELLATASQSHELADDTTDLDAQTLADVAGNLRNVKRSGLVEILNRVPASWPVSDEELEALGWYLEARAEPVASRLEAL